MFYSQLKKIIFIVGFFIITSLHFSCQNLMEKDRFAGFEKIIDTNKIRPVAGKPHCKVIDVNIPPLDSGFFDYNKYLDSIHFIPLQTTTASLIGKISKVFFSKNRIIVVDSRITESVFIFDAKGRFINKIGVAKKQMNGTSVNDLTHFFCTAYFDTEKKIILYDDQKSKLYYFDDNGNFIKSERTYVAFSDFMNIKGSSSFAYLSLYAGNKHIPFLQKSDLYLGDKDTRITQIAPQAVQKLTIKGNYYYDDNLISSGDAFFYTPVFSDLVYQVEGGSQLDVYPKLHLHFPGPNINDKVKESPHIDVSQLNQLLNSHQYYSFHGKVLKTNDSIYYVECTKNDQLGYFYSTQTKHIIGGHISSTQNAGDSTKVDFYAYPMASNGHEFISLLEPDFWAYNKNSLYTARFSKAIQGFNKNSNPILIFYTLRKF